MENNNETVTKTEEEIREEVRKEIERENELKEQEEIQKDKVKKTSKKVARIIWSLAMTLVFVYVVFVTIMGILNMQRLNEDKTPMWYFSTKVVEKDGKKDTYYNFGLYDIVKTEDASGSKAMIKPFFIK